MIRRVSGQEYEAFLAERIWAVVLFDAPWDIGPGAMIRPRFERAQRAFGKQASFAQVNCDEEHDLARTLGLLNLPTVAYYRSGVLVAALIGAQQDVRARTSALIYEEPLGRQDGCNNTELPWSLARYWDRRRQRCQGRFRD